ncbi:MAG: T9SS type A sorting domain-containing protein [Chitinophagales bacterium]|nr:T9SS type A sorting domain-containing protein [Chitinophagales bacterium]
MFVYSAKAQAPYTGGNGDGYAMAALTLRNVGIEPTIIDVLHVYPNPVQLGNHVNIQAAVGTHLSIADITGRILWEGELVLQPFAFSFPSAGLYFLRLERGKTCPLVVLP